MMSRLILKLVALAMLVFCGVLQSEQAWAQTACTPVAKGSDNTFGSSYTRYVRVATASDRAGGNGCVAADTRSYSNLVNTSDFKLYLPAPTSTSQANGATDPAVINVEKGNNDLDITQISCPGGTVGGVGTIRGTILLSPGNSCTLHALWNNGGAPISFSGGTLTNNGGDYQYNGGGIINGDNFGGLALSLAQADGSVAENVAYISQAPTLTGTPVGAVSYSLGGTDALRFTVAASTGVVSMVARDFEAPVDADGDNAYVYTLTVRDTDGNAATTADVTVTVAPAVVSEADPDKVARQALTTDTVIETANSVVANIGQQINVIRRGGGSTVQGVPQPTNPGEGPPDAGEGEGVNLSGYTLSNSFSQSPGSQRQNMELSEFVSGLQFHVSVNSLFKDDKLGHLSATGDGTTPASIPGGRPDGGDLSDVGTLSVWGLGSWTGLENKRNNGTVDSRYKGDIFTYSLGSDYRFTEELAAGLALSLSTTDIDTTFNEGTFEEKSYLVSPYLSYAMDDLVLSVVGGYGIGDVDSSGSEGTAFVAETESTTLFLQGNIQNTYRFWEDEVLELTPSLSALTARKTLDAYQDSAGQDRGETVSNVFRLRPELKTGYRYNFTGGSITPYVQGGVILDFKDSVNDDDGAYSLGGGFTINTDGGFTTTLDYDREIGRDDYERQTITGAVTYGLNLSPHDTVTPTVQFNQDQDAGIRQDYGLEYRHQKGEYSFDLGGSMGRDEESTSVFGSNIGYTWSPNDNTTLSGKAGSQDIMASKYDARIEFGIKF